MEIIADTDISTMTDEELNRLMDCIQKEKSLRYNATLKKDIIRKHVRPHIDFILEQYGLPTSKNRHDYWVEVFKRYPDKDIPQEIWNYGMPFDDRFSQDSWMASESLEKALITALCTITDISTQNVDLTRKTKGKAYTRKDQIRPDKIQEWKNLADTIAKAMSATTIQASGGTDNE
jgi:hypothetical protein